MADDLSQRAWEALVNELGLEDATRFWRAAGLDRAPAASNEVEAPCAVESPSSAAWGQPGTPTARQRDAARIPLGKVRPAWVPWENPVVTLALRRQMRHLGTFGLQLAYVGLLAVIFLIVATVVVSQNTRTGRSPALIGPQIGRAFWMTSALIQIMGLGIVAAVLGACAFSVEREQRTSDALWLTLLRPRDVLLGKSIALSAFLALLVFSGLPLLCLTFMLGGVSPWDVARSIALLLASAAGYLGVGLYCSACSRRAIRAVVAAALSSGALLFGVPAVAILFGSMYNWMPSNQQAFFVSVILLNPLIAMGHLIEPMRPLPPGLSEGCTLFYAGLALAAALAAGRRLAIEARGRA
jgi:ABC-type transport system involved in multi-copper enzyme maturation permease subunit